MKNEGRNQKHQEISRVGAEEIHSAAKEVLEWVMKELRL